MEYRILILPVTIFLFISLHHYGKQKVKKNKYHSTQINETTFFLETEASDLEIYKYGFIHGPED